MSTDKNTCHRDGTITYWSVYAQVWICRADPSDIPDRELAAMSHAERERIIRMRDRAVRIGGGA